TNMEGYRLLGLALFDELVRENIAHPDAGWNAARREAVRETVIAGLDPRDEGGALLNLGKVLEWAGKFEEAYAAFQQSLKILGPSPAIYDRLARTAYALDRYDEAVAYLQATLELAPDMPGVHAKLATILAKLDKTDAAIRHSKAELEITPGNYVVHAGLAKLYEKQGDAGAALEHYEKAVQFKADFVFARLRIAYLLLAQERHDEARLQCEAVLRLNPRQYRAHTALGMILKQQGDYRQAMQHFSEALRLEPGDRVAEENLQQLRAQVGKRETRS
ncbi:MAG TPA: tetratricopeptide repeat protein, partial [Gammaproteobacteria bacterium]|nr:tetratricopeptide repeat protein [Gammaproteobacteria bacterium]